MLLTFDFIEIPFGQQFSKRNETHSIQAFELLKSFFIYGVMFGGSMFYGGREKGFVEILNLLVAANITSFVDSEISYEH